MIKNMFLCHNFNKHCNVFDVFMFYKHDFYVFYDIKLLKTCFLCFNVIKLMFFDVIKHVFMS